MSTMTLEQARDLLASYLDDRGCHIEAENVRKGIDLESYENELKLVGWMYRHTRLAQPAQAVDEPIVWWNPDADFGDPFSCTKTRRHTVPLFTRALSGEKAGPVGGWQPIETAPINETVFCYHPMVGRFPGYQSRIDGTSAVTWHNTWSQESGVMPPTHWQPLPASPAPDKEG